MNLFFHLVLPVVSPLSLPSPLELVDNDFFEDSRQNPDQQSESARGGLTEGDIVITQVNRDMSNQGKASSARNGLLNYRWEYNIWPYVLDYNAVPRPYRLWVRLKLDYVMEHEYKQKLGDCLTLCERSRCPEPHRNSRNYVKIRFEKDGCWSSVGRQGGEQIINVAFPSCLGNKGTLAHEIMHSLGFYHEQSRPDRDGYVIIDKDNIIEGKYNNFAKQTKDTTEIYDYYDWNSVMHYDSYAFRNKKYSGLSAILTRTIYPNPLSISSLESITEDDFRGTVVGQRVGLSFCDELKIRRHYAAPGLVGGKKCELWTPRTCRCKYINKNNGYDAKMCEDLIKNDPLNNITEKEFSSAFSIKPKIVEISSLIFIPYFIHYMLFE